MTFKYTSKRIKYLKSLMAKDMCKRIGKTHLSKIK